MAQKPPPRVLIIQDESTTGQRLDELVECIGYAVVGRLTSVDEALWLIVQTQPDAILVDLQLAGHRADLEAIAMLQAKRPTPAVLLTADQTPELLHQAKLAGVSDFLTKPVSPSELGSAIAIAIARFEDSVELRRLNAELHAQIIKSIQSQEALQLSEARLAAIVNGARDHIYIKDANLIYTLCNPTAARLFGLTPEELIGKCDTELWGPEEGLEIEAVDRRVLAGETVESTSARLVKGKWVTFHRIKAPLRDRSGKIVGVCGIARDVTEKVKQEEIFRRAQKNQSITLLAGGIAHEFNSLLTSILGQGNLALLRAIDPGLKIILSSGYDEDEVMSRFRSRGLAQNPTAFLQKPYNLSIVTRLVQRVVSLPSLLCV